MNNEPKYSLAIHGGAGVRQNADYELVREDLKKLLQFGKNELERGASSLEIVQEIVTLMEKTGYYVAGKGSIPDQNNVAELDAALMCGKTLRIGAVAAVANIISPIKLAKDVLEKSKHVLFVGEGAVEFAKENGHKFVDDKDYYVVPVGLKKEDMTSTELSHGTVGAVALDTYGDMACATSTGGVFGKKKGRVGDTPLIGCGSYCDNNVAVSCTGIGEYFVKNVFAAKIAVLVTYAKMNLSDAVELALNELKKLGGDGGVIAIDKNYNMIISHRSSGIKAGYVSYKDEIKLFI